MAHGWSVEDVAFQTHIPAARIRDLENDDLSKFANLTYAKSFLRLYSRHVNLDIEDYLDQFDTRALSNVTGREYARTAGLLNVISSATVEPPRQGSGAAAAWVVVVVFVALAFAFLKWRSGGRSGDAAEPPARERTVQPVRTEDRGETRVLPDPDLPALPAEEAPLEEESGSPPPRATPIPENEEPPIESILPPVPRPFDPDARAAG